MKCRKCGLESGDKSFCENCGAAMGNERKRFPVLPIVIAAMVVVAIAVALVLVLGNHENNEDVISIAAEYIENEEYEKAIDEYEKILDEDDENVAAYLGMAEAYELLDDIEEAIEVLEKGYDKTSSSRIKKALEKLVALVEGEKTDSRSDDGVTESGTESAPAATESERESVPAATESKPESVPEATESGLEPPYSSETPDHSSDDLPEEFIMPNLIGLSWQEAYGKYSPYMNLVASQEWSEYEKDTIFYQELPEGRKVSIGSTVTVKVSKGIKMLELQDLSGYAIDSAERQLKKDGFIVKKIFEDSNNVAKNNVIRTEPAAHEIIEYGSTVTLFVSIGAAETIITVPPLTDMPVYNALARCEEYGLIAEIKSVDSAEYGKDVVISQSIEQGEFVGRNTVIVLEVSSGVAPILTKDFMFTIPESAKGEFEFLFYVDGIRDTERGREILDIGLEQNKVIPYEVSGRIGEVKEFVVRVRSTATDKMDTYLVVEFSFDDDGINSEIKEANRKVFETLAQ